MEEYLQFMKTLQSQVNDVEDEATKLSADEQTHSTIIHTLEADIVSVRSEKMQLQEDIEQMMKENGQLCSQMLEKRRRIASLESDSSNITQAMELIQQELVWLSSKLTEKSIHYLKVTVDINARLQQQQVWVRSYMTSREQEKHSKVEDETDGVGETEGRHSFDNDPILENMMKQAVDETKCRVNDHAPELKVVGRETMEEEYNALLSEKIGETEYLKSLQEQVERLKGLSHLVNCACGEEYGVRIDIGAWQKDALGKIQKDDKRN